jgi:beta-barrel assembly-enhancing protease
MRHRWWLGVLLVGMALAATGCLRPSPGSPFVLSPAQATDIGRAASAAIEGRVGGRLDKPAVQAYVATVGERVARPIGPSPWPYHFIVLGDAAPRLFSLPGGQIFITRGLLDRLQSEAELAGVLGCELAHVSRRHDEIQANLSQSALERAADAAEVLLAGTRRLSRSEVDDLDRAAVAWVSVRYSPGMQEEADRLGLDYMAAAGYHPAEMVRAVSLVAGLDDLATAAGRAEAVRGIVGRKYADRAGRIGRQEFQREVLDRLK